MKKTLCKDVPFVERSQTLRDSCDKVVVMGYAKSFSNEELDTRKTQLSEVAIKINDIEEDKKSVMDDFKEQLKPLLEDKKQLLTELKNRSEYVTEECYQMQNQEEGVIETYNKFGDMIESHAMRPEERQRTIFHQLKTGTDK